MQYLSIVSLLSLFLSPFISSSLSFCQTYCYHIRYIVMKDNQIHKPVILSLYSACMLWRPRSSLSSFPPSCSSCLRSSPQQPKSPMRSLSTPHGDSLSSPLKPAPIPLSSSYVFLYCYASTSMMQFTLYVISAC